MIGVAMTMGFLGPYDFNTPHVHPRSSEINVVVQGRLGTQFITENGVDAIEINYLSQNMMTVFPPGSTHVEYNPDCTNATFVAGFANEDPGVEQVAQTLFSFVSQIVSATLGGVTAISGTNLAAYEALIPKNVALGVQACLQKCGFKA
jgi:hypothetical protein